MGNINLDAYTKDYRNSLKFDPKTGRIYNDGRWSHEKENNGNELYENDFSITKEKKINIKEKILLWLDFYIFSRFRK
jgi:hypothetical protein